MTLIFLMSCSAHGEPEIQQSQFISVGTLVALTVVADDAKAQKAEQTVRAALAKIDADWHPWRAGSALAKINHNLMETGSSNVPEHMRPLIQRANTLSRESSGAFDPAIGALVKLWGFHNDEEVPTVPPAEAQLADVRNSLMSMQWISIKDESVVAKPGVQLDFGAFAKGQAVADAINDLRSSGISQAIVNIGGDLQVLGTRGDRPWRIGVRHPRAEGALAVIAMRDGEAVFTSGDYERFFDYEGERYHHILDPRTGVPASGLTSVTVLHADAALADAASTALFVAGPERWEKTAAGMNVDQVMVVLADGSIRMTAAMSERIDIVAEPKPEVEIIQP